MKTLEEVLEFIRTTQLNCAYKLILLYSLIKLKSIIEISDTGNLLDSFISFYNIKKKF